MEAEWSFTATEAGRHLVLPDGRCDVIYRSVGGGAMTPVVTGPATQPYWVAFQPGDTWVGLRFRPEYGGLLWGRRLGQAQNSVLRGEAAFNLIPSLKPNTDLTTLLDTLAAPSPPQGLTRALDVIHASGGRIQIDRLASFAGWSARHLTRLFRDHIGLTAKVYAQLVQFHRALRLIRSGGLSPTATAYEGGYADQSHLTRAFRRFGGFSPAAMPPELSLPTLFPM